MPDFLAFTETFTRVYDNNQWATGSGPGSLASECRPYMDFVSRFIQYNGIRTVVDIGCGDWQFSRDIDWSNTSYLGYDVVNSLIDKNQMEFGNDHVAFKKLQDINEIPACDLLLCKDLLQHLPIKDIFEFLAKFRSGSRFILVTNDSYASSDSSITDKEMFLLRDSPSNFEIVAGQARPIRLDLAPFFFDAPTVLRFMVKWHNLRWIKDTCLL